METVPCDLCGSPESVLVAKQTDKLHSTTEEVFYVVSCSHCGLTFTNPRPSRKEIGRYYAELYAFHDAPTLLRRLGGALASKLVNSPLSILVDLVPPIAHRLIPYLKPKISDPVRAYYAKGGQGDFLDIGCGGGASAHFWGKNGALLAYRSLASVAGVEVAERARASLHVAGIEAWPNLESVPANRKFGMIRMNWSLEHVHAPSEYFSFIRDRLLPGGLAMIAVPNYDGLIYRVAPDCLELPIHLFHFKPSDIYNYAVRYGLRVVNMQTFSYPHMFVAAAKVGLLPEAFAKTTGLRSAKAFQTTLHQFDKSNMGNDLIAILEADD